MFFLNDFLRYFQEIYLYFDTVIVRQIGLQTIRVTVIKVQGVSVLVALYTSNHLFMTCRTRD